MEVQPVFVRETVVQRFFVMFSAAGDSQFELNVSALELTRMLYRGRRGERVYSALYKDEAVVVKYLRKAGKSSSCSRDIFEPFNKQRSCC